MYINAVVSDIISHEALGAKTFVFSRREGGALPPFRAGQYISVRIQIGKSFVSRPYSLCSSPSDAEKGQYAITVQSNPGGFAAEWMLEHFHRGFELVITEPQGTFTYNKHKNTENVIALAGGSGLTPFLSMARAIRDGRENFNLTILFGNGCAKDILFKEELDSICKICSKVRVVNVLSEEKREGCEFGFITSDLIKKYAADNYSIMVCGPGAMYSFLRSELKKIHLPKRLIRFEMQAVEKNPPETDRKEYLITVKKGQISYDIKASAKEPILVAIERAGIRTASCCRSGQCGMCKSRVISGTFFAPPVNDGRRFFDKLCKRIHPCATFPTSDMIIRIPGDIR